MKKNILVSFLVMLPFLASCASFNKSVPGYYPTAPAAIYPTQTPPPGGTAYTATELSSLRAGVLPDTSFTNEERKLAGYLVRKTVPVFPMKIGVILYKTGGSLPDGDRKTYVDNFLQTLRTNTDIGQVVEISPNLLPQGSSINEIRALGARFQVSSVFVISESYPFPTENKEAIVTPIDSITGTRTWESFSKVDVYGIDILNGVFIFSISSGIKENKKYNRTSSNIKNPDLLLVRSTADKAWGSLNEKIGVEIKNYKDRVLNDKVIPIIAETPLPVL